MINIAEQRLVNPKPGGTIEKARNFGVDLTLIIERLRLSHEERLIELQKAMVALAEIRNTAHRKRKPIIL